MLDDALRHEMVGAVLGSGLDDWVSLGELDSIALFYGAASLVLGSRRPNAPEWVIEPVVREVVERGLMAIGDVYTHGRFVPFDGDDEAAIQWMMGILRTADGWTLDAWLALTEAGETFANTLPRARYLVEPWPFDADGNRL